MPSAAALDYRKFGLKEYKAEKWEAAVSAFDKVSRLRCSHIVIQGGVG